MKPIVLIHGYSAESRGTALRDIAGIYGTLPKALKAKYGRNAIVEIDVSRYVTLEDGVTIDDLSRGLDRALREEYPRLLKSEFHAIVHSTGALVARNWIRRFSAKPSPIQSLIYLAGANFGSGWAHVGKGQLAKWGRKVFQGGAERGMRVLDALEIGSSWTIDLHLELLEPEYDLRKKYTVFEHVVIGSQADAAWYMAPIRYAKEDGSDGVVRVSASNLNFNYVRFEPTKAARLLSWRSVSKELTRHLEKDHDLPHYYRIAKESQPGSPDRPLIPLAIPFECAHSGDEMGVVRGSEPREEVLGLIDLALGSNKSNWPDRVGQFNSVTARTYDRVKERHAPTGWLRKLVAEPRAQYDAHAQVIFRLKDQDGRPVTNFDIFFDSVAGYRDESLPIGRLMEDKHRNGKSPNVITFYLRTDAFKPDEGTWMPQVPEVDGCYLEITGKEPETDEIVYLPMRHHFTLRQLMKWIRPHETTIIDVKMLRLPSPKIFMIKSYSR